MIISDPIYGRSKLFLPSLCTELTSRSLYISDLDSATMEPSTHALKISLRFAFCDNATHPDNERVIARAGLGPSHRTRNLEAGYTDLAPGSLGTASPHDIRNFDACSAITGNTPDVSNSSSINLLRDYVDVAGKVSSKSRQPLTLGNFLRLGPPLWRSSDHKRL